MLDEFAMGPSPLPSVAEVVVVPSSVAALSERIEGFPTEALVGSPLSSPDKMATLTEEPPPVLESQLAAQVSDVTERISPSSLCLPTTVSTAVETALPATVPEAQDNALVVATVVAPAGGAGRTCTQCRLAKVRNDEHIDKS